MANSQDLLAARRYAQALFELAREFQWDEAIEDELVAFSQALVQSPELSKYVSNPSLGAEQKRGLIRRLYNGHAKPYYPLLLNFFTLLFNKNRFHLVPEIALEFKRIADEFQGQSVIDVYSAVPLEAQDESDITRQLQRIAGGSISVRKIVDPSLVGGVMVRVKNKIIDGTIKHQIERMKKALVV